MKGWAEEDGEGEGGIGGKGEVPEEERAREIEARADESSSWFCTVSGPT